MVKYNYFYVVTVIKITAKFFYLYVTIKFLPVMAWIFVDVKLVILAFPQETAPNFVSFIVVWVLLGKQCKVVTM